MKSPKENKDMVAFGARLTELRRRHNFTQEALAEKLGVSAVVLGYYEQGRRSPSFVTMRKLAKALDIKLSELFEGL